MAAGETQNDYGMDCQVGAVRKSRDDVRLMQTSASAFRSTLQRISEPVVKSWQLLTTQLLTAHLLTARLLATICALLLTCALSSRASAQANVPRSIMQGLAKQLNADSPAIRDCDTKAEFKFSARALDLNGDKQPEYLLTSVNACECGQVNCSMWVYRTHDNGYELLLEGDGYTLVPSATSHAGYRDISTTSRGNAVIVDHVSYAFTGKRYEQVGSSIENLETHEKKATERRIQFAKGASSATVSGSASLGFPDSWTFIANRGQILALTLTKTNGVATSFTLIGPDTGGGRVIADSQSTFNNPLPRDGKYIILVDSRGDGRATYKLSISIR